MKIPDKMRMTLKMARQMKELTQEEAAQRIGVSKDTLGNYERGKSYPDIPVLRKIEEVYGVSYDRLIFLPTDFGLTEENSDEFNATGEKTVSEEREDAPGVQQEA